MKRKKINLFLYLLLICLFSMSIVEKTIDNDTYFSIPVGNKILNQGFYTEEDFTFIEGLKYQNVRWIFDVIISTIYNQFGYCGIYVFVMISAVIIAYSLFYILYRRNNNVSGAFIFTIITMYMARNVFTARAQMISFLLFIWEYYYIYNLIKSKNVKYIILLFVDAVLLANIHASVFPLYFIMYLPFIAEEILSKIKIWNKDNSKIIIEDNKSIIFLIFTMILGGCGGLLSPSGVAPYINIFKTVGEVSSDFISEMKPVVPVTAIEFTCFWCAIIGILTFSKAKIKLSDSLMILGFTILTFSNYRSIYFLIFFGMIGMYDILTSFYEEYKLNEFVINDFKIKIGVSIVIILFILVFSVSNFEKHFLKQYEDYNNCAVGVVDYIYNNFSKEEISKMRIYNGYNYGSYLEFKKIPVFIDPRAEIYLSTYNDTHVLEDYLKLEFGMVHYNVIFQKYNINYVLVENDSIIKNYIYEDTNWKLLYKDEYFCFYEKNT